MTTEPHLQHFGLREAPFLLAPDPEFLYASTQHSLAQAYLSYALLNRDTFVVLTGETGTGKTTLVNRLVNTAGDRVAVARVAHSQLTPVELLQSLLLGFGIRAFDKQKVELLTLLEAHIAEQHDQRRTVLIVVDDAHNLGVDVLEEIRLATQLGARKDGAVNLILSGRPSLRQTLELPVLEPLHQRIRFNFELRPLTADECAAYIQRRVEIAGAGSALFTEDCVPLVMRYTGGVPRLINILCDTALMSAFTEGASQIDARLMRGAVDELDWAPQDEGAPVLGFGSHGGAPPVGDDAPLIEAELAAFFEDSPALGDLPAGLERGGDDVAPIRPMRLPIREGGESTLAAGDWSDEAGRAPLLRALREAGEDMDGAAPHRATFVVLQDGREVARHMLRGDRLTIGREHDNDIQVPAEYVSRHHAQVSWRRGGCWLADLNSTNGTFVNGLRVRRRLLRNGDEIQFGRHLLRVECDAPSQDAVAADGDEAWLDTLVIMEDRAKKA
jgi:general secretion pathway protein A